MNCLEDFIGSHLLEWNMQQKKIWMYFVSKNKVEINNTEKFLLFSEWFNRFYKKNYRYPSISEAEEELTQEEIL